jgi:carbon monoxide dehydrogenase subunit G
MARLFETVDTTLPIEDAFAFVADFSNSERWDPGTAWSKAVDDGSPRVGSRYRLGVRMGGRVAEMEYRITELVPDGRVVLEGTGSNVSAVDDIRFSRAPGGTRVEYRADIRLHGWLRPLQPFTGHAFAAIARNAQAGMQRALDQLATQKAAER